MAMSTGDATQARFALRLNLFRLFLSTSAIDERASLFVLSNSSSFRCMA
jgi:hypothetical protein